MRRLALALAGLALLSVPARAEMPLSTTPAWTSTALGHVATGGGWADLDGDGWVDMVAANGNDMARQSIVVYRNDGFGGLPLAPTWSSTDIDYHGHLDLGDVNGDGLIDLVVGVYLGPAGFGDPGRAKLYLGNGTGGFSATPMWTAGTHFYCFGVALGDVNGDGRLDLACTAGESYDGHPERLRVYFNTGGSFAAAPDWQSDDSGYALDVTWSDVDLDGDLDLAASGEISANRVYFNRFSEGGGLDTTAGWTSADSPSYANTIAFGDWNGDGYPDLAVADNNQLGGVGRFKVYANNLGGLGTTPTWLSSNGGYGSHVSWADLDLDGDPDLAAGRWWGAVRLYENTGGGLTAAPVWTSSTSSVIENLFWEDVDNDGLVANGLTTATGDGARQGVQLATAPVREVLSVTVAGSPLDPSEYVLHPATGWLALAAPPAPGASIAVGFRYSRDLDLGCTNWDSTVGNYLFLNTGTLVSAPETTPLGFSLAASPNPLHTRTVFRYRGEGASRAALDVFDLQGRRVRSLHAGALAGGLLSWEWDARDEGGARMPAGVYFARFVADGRQASVKLILL
jgi:hypothetical protein